MNNEEKVVRLFQVIADVGDDLIEEAGTARKHKKTAFWRWGLVAACLCAVLLGTAGAVQYFGVRIIGEADGDVDYWLAGGIAYYRRDSLSNQVEELDGPFATKAFQSWEEMEEFIGVDMMNNPVLDASPASSFFHSWNVGSNRIAGRFLAFGSTGLTSIRTIGCYEIGEVNITVEGVLFTDRMAELNEDWDERFIGYAFPEGTQVNLESYTAPSGLEVQMIERVDDDYKATFTLNGIPFVVTTDGPSKSNREVLFQVLDGFQV